MHKLESEARAVASGRVLMVITSAEEGGYVFGAVCLSVCLFVCLSVGLLGNL